MNQLSDDLGLKVNDLEDFTEDFQEKKDDLTEKVHGLSHDKLDKIKGLLKNIQNDLNRLLKLINKEESEEFLDDTTPSLFPEEFQGEERIIEGVFDGQEMVGPDGRRYTVPVNYASKSKLVEGDILKLTITPEGGFMYKQIGPIERERIMGVLTKEGDDYCVISEGKKWKLLKASITYFKGKSGDEAIIFVPKNTPSKWGALENIIKRN